MTDETPASDLPEPLEDVQASPLPAALEEANAQLAAARGEIADLREAVRAAAGREQSLADELQHRVRNVLAVLRSIYRRSFENGVSQEEFAEHFGGRLDAIARYQADIADIRSDGVDLNDMVRDELLSVQCQEGPRCSIAGPPVRLRQKSAEMMGLAIHELTTNAIKFGALSSGGTISVKWSLAGARNVSVLHFHWKEAGVSLLSAAPRPQGFGQNLIEQAIPYQLGATTSFEFRPGGLDCSIELPLSAS